jgi:hypothetical protein
MMLAASSVGRGVVEYHTPAGVTEMKPIVVDAAHRDKLLAATDVAEVRDDSGKVIGQFVPKSLSIVHVVEGELPSDEELDRRMREGRSFTTQEVLERLHELRGKSK